MNIIIKIIRRILYILSTLIGGFAFALSVLLSPIVYILTGDTDICTGAMDRYENWCNKINPDK